MFSLMAILTLRILPTEKQQALFFPGEKVFLKSGDDTSIPVTVLSQLDNNEVQVNFASTDTGVVQIRHLFRKKQPASRMLIRCWLVESLELDQQHLFWLAVPCKREQFNLPDGLTEDAKIALADFRAKAEAAAAKRALKREKTKEVMTPKIDGDPSVNVKEPVRMMESNPPEKDSGSALEESVIMVEDLKRSLKKGSLRSVCVEVLEDAGGEGLTAQEMVKRIEAKGLKSFEGMERPHSRVYTAMKSEPAAFQHVGPSQFALKEIWIKAGRPTVASEKKSSRFLISEVAAQGRESAVELLEKAKGEVAKRERDLERAISEHDEALRLVKAEASTRSPVKVPRGSLADQFEREAEERFPFNESDYLFEGDPNNRREALAHKTFVNKVRDDIAKQRAAFVHDCWLERQREASKGRRKAEVVLNRAKEAVAKARASLEEAEKSMTIAERALAKADAWKKKNELKEAHAKQIAESKAEKEKQKAISKAKKEEEKRYPMDDQDLQRELLRNAQAQAAEPPPLSAELPEMEFENAEEDCSFGDIAAAAQCMTLLQSLIPEWSPPDLAGLLNGDATATDDETRQIFLPLLKYVLLDPSHIKCGVRRVRRWLKALSEKWTATPAWQEVLRKYFACKYDPAQQDRVMHVLGIYGIQSEQPFEKELPKAMQACAFEALPPRLCCKALRELCDDALQTGPVRNLLDDRVDQSQALRGLRRQARRGQREAEAKANARSLIKLGALRSQSASITLSRREANEFQRKILEAIETLHARESEEYEDEEDDDDDKADLSEVRENIDGDQDKSSKRRKIRQRRKLAVPAPFVEAWSALGGRRNSDGNFYSPATGETLKSIRELLIHLNVATEDPGSYCLATQACEILGEPNLSAPSTCKETEEEEAAAAFPLDEAKFEYQGDENDRKALLAHRRSVEDEKQKILKKRSEFLRKRKEQHRVEAAAFRQAEAARCEVDKVRQREEEALDKKLSASAVRVSVLGRDRNFARFFFFPQTFGLKAGIYIEGPEGNQWRVIKSIEQLDNLINSLEDRGVREHGLKKNIKDRYLTISAALKQRTAEEKTEMQVKAREQRTTHSQRAAAAAVKSMSEKDLAKAAVDASVAVHKNSNILVSSVTKMGHIANGLQDLCNLAADLKVDIPGGLKSLEEKVDSAGHWNSLSMMKEVLQDVESAFSDVLAPAKRANESNSDGTRNSPDDNADSDDSMLQMRTTSPQADLEWMESSSQEEDFLEKNNVAVGALDHTRVGRLWWSDLERQAWSQHLSDSQTIASVAYSASVLDDRVRLALRHHTPKTRGCKPRHSKRKRAR